MNTGYVFTREEFEPALAAFEPVWTRHYAEMKARLEKNGIRTPPFKPQIPQYIEANKAGYMHFFTVRFDGEPVGYSVVYLTNDMHNGELIAMEDTIYIVPEHRNGVGRHFARNILRFLKDKGAGRMVITAVTDPRAAKLWGRMGFREMGVVMSLDFKEYV